MKSLFKISSRYVMTAALLTILAIVINVAAAFLFIWKISNGSEYIGMSTEDMEGIEAQMQYSSLGCELSAEGSTILENSNCIWAMRLDRDGDVIWEYQLPREIPHHYSLTDVASFTRWYIEDYPVFVWKGGENLMVYGFDKSVARFDFYGSTKFWGQFPYVFLWILILNLVIIAVLALFFGFRFYRSLRPIVKGIEQLSRQEDISLPERGTVGDLARQLNQTSVILQTQHQQLEKRDQARTQWIAGVSHDVRTPLSLIMGFSDELSHAPELSGNLQKKAETIRRQSQVIGNLIADLNLTVKLEYQSQPLRKEWISPAKLVREYVADLYNQNPEEACQITPIISKKAEKVAISADKQLLLRVFRNLVGNSLRHNPSGCEIQITMDLVSERLRLLFSDDGEGVPQIVVDILTGKQEESPEIHIMGLRIVLQIVKAHGGTVEFVPTGLGGYSVCMELPACQS